MIFVARGAHLAALRERGLIIESKLGDVSLPKVEATDDPSTLGSADVVLICVKLWDTRRRPTRSRRCRTHNRQLYPYRMGFRKTMCCGELFAEDGLESTVDRVASIEKTLSIYELAQFTPRV